MKKTSAFTLVRKSVSGSKTATSEKSLGISGEGGLGRKLSANRTALSSPELKAMLETVKKIPNAAKTLGTLDPQFQKALASSFVTKASRVTKQSPNPKPNVSPNILPVLRNLISYTKVFRVGVLDMGAWIGGFPKLLQRLNDAQSLFTIFEVQAPVPAGLLKTPIGMAQWASEQTVNSPNTCNHKDWKPHIIDDEFFVAGENIRNELGLDYLIGMTPAMVAGKELDGTIYWNHRGSALGRVILLSTTDLREFSELAGRPYEASIGLLLVSSLFVSINSKLDYHLESTGCIFDYNENRESIVTTIKRMTVDSQCLKKMTIEEQLIVNSMLSSLRRMRRRAR